MLPTHQHRGRGMERQQQFYKHELVQRQAVGLDHRVGVRLLANWEGLPLTPASPVQNPSAGWMRDRPTRTIP